VSEAAAAAPSLFPPGSAYSTVVVRCHASHTDPERPTDSCNTFLGHVAGPVRIARLTTRAPDDPDGLQWLRCPRAGCRRWNAFAILPPASLPHASREAQVP
jgi:hypothetical protein